MELLAFGDAGWSDELLFGAVRTLGLAVMAMPIGLVLGMALAFAKASREITYRILGNALTTALRGLPELLTILLIYILGQRAIDSVMAWFGGGSVELSIYWSGVAALSIVFAAYASEVFLGSLRALQGSLLEAASALSLGTWVKLRYIIFPEMFRLSRPGLSNLWLSLLKQTSLVSVIGYGELSRAGYTAASSSNAHIFFYVVICIAYFGLCGATGPVFDALVRALSSEVRKHR